MHAQGAAARVLNVGFGLGIIDGYIQELGPAEHVIVEAHPDVLAHMRQTGWEAKPGVRVVAGRWQDVVEQLGPFDGVFFDTYGEYAEDMREFHAHLPRLLAPGGVYSFFNGLCPDNLFFNMVQSELVKTELARCACVCVCWGGVGGEIPDEAKAGKGEQGASALAPCFKEPLLQARGMAAERMHDRRGG